MTFNTIEVQNPLTSSALVQLKSRIPADQDDFNTIEVTPDQGNRYINDGLTRNLRERNVGTHSVSTPGGVQTVKIINESGLPSDGFNSIEVTYTPV